MGGFLNERSVGILRTCATAGAGLFAGLRGVRAAVCVFGSGAGGKNGGSGFGGFPCSFEQAGGAGRGGRRGGEIACQIHADLASEIDDDPSILAERAGLKLWQAREIYRYIEERVERRVTEAKCNVIVRVCGVFLKAGSNVKLLFAGLAYAADLAVTNQLGTMQDWAVRNGLSRAAVSKVAKFWQRELGLPASSHLRGEEKCQAYSEAQTQKHWRKQKVGGLSRIWDGGMRGFLGS